MTSLSKKIYWSLSEKYRDSQKKSPVLESLHIEITNRCNLQCRHCYMESTCAGKDSLNTKQWCDFFSQVRRDFGARINIQITGGEALVRSDIFKILNHIHNLGFSCSLVSNGVLLDEHAARKLVGSVQSIAVSLDGFCDSHNYLRGSNIFDRVVNNISRLKESGFKTVSLKTTVYRRNLTELPEFYDYIKSFGVSRWQLFAMEPLGRGKLNKDEILSLPEYLQLCRLVDQWRGEKDSVKVTFGEGINEFMCSRSCDSYKYHRCNAGITFCGVLHDGSIVSCVQDDRADQPVYGNIKNDSLKKIWDSSFAETRDANYNFCSNHHYLNQLTKEK